MTMEFLETRLDNGLQVIAEISPRVHSVAIGFFVRAGARDEAAELSGVSHFLEHMAFKGTARRSADDVNRGFDEIGAQHNASTSEEVTMFYAAVLPEYVPHAFELLADILRPALRPDDFELEKQVILEEIGMYDDQPTFLAYDKAMQKHFAGHPLGRSILGSTESIRALSVDQMRAYHADRYRAGNITLAVAGKIDWDTVRRLAEAHCGGWPPGCPMREVVEARPAGGVEILPRASSQQQHVMQLAAAPPARHPRRVAAELLALVVGDDCASRYYWDLVEPGHVESAVLDYNEFDGSGAFFSYFNGRPENTRENLDRVRTLLEKVQKHGITAEELEQAKGKKLSRIVLLSERPMGRLASLGGNWIYRNEYCPVARDLADVQRTTLDEVHQLLDEYPLQLTTTVTIGPLTTLDG